MKSIVTQDHYATSRALEGTFTLSDDGRRMRLVGQIIDAPDAWKVVASGLADPYDDECKARFTPEQVAFAKEVGHPALMRLHSEAVQEAKDAVEMAAFIDPSEEEEN